MNDELYLNLVDFQSVLSETLDEKLLIGKNVIDSFYNYIVYVLHLITLKMFWLIDVLGQVLDCGAVETIQCAGGYQRKKLDFTLRDIK